MRNRELMSKDIIVGKVKLIEEELSDNSHVYNVELFVDGVYTIFNMRNKKTAEQLVKLIDEENIDISVSITL